MNIFMVLYTEGGHHHPHQDGRYMGKYRLITTLGSSEKQMWFFKRNKCCGVKMPHGTMILLSKEGGGVNESSKVIHAVKMKNAVLLSTSPKATVIVCKQAQDRLTPSSYVLNPLQ